MIWLIPEQKGETRKEHEALRKRARDTVRPWLTHTRTTQGWGMFAPNPPRHNVFMQVIVTDDAGEGWDMNSDVYSQTRRPIPFVFNDRMRKMNRRIIGGEGSGKGSWYQKWYARWQCRDFALSHGGRVPKEVELVRWSYRIPTPETMAERGWYDPMKQLHEYGTREVVHTERCANAVLGQPSPKVAARRGVESSVEHRPWIKRRPETLGAARRRVSASRTSQARPQGASPRDLQPQPELPAAEPSSPPLESESSSPPSGAGGGVVPSSLPPEPVSSAPSSSSSSSPTSSSSSSPSVVSPPLESVPAGASSTVTITSSRSHWLSASST